MKTLYKTLLDNHHQIHEDQWTTYIFSNIGGLWFLVGDVTITEQGCSFSYRTPEVFTTFEKCEKNFRKHTFDYEKGLRYVHTEWKTRGELIIDLIEKIAKEYSNLFLICYYIENALA